ncbi:MAG: acetate--CoA ligase family protein [Candidatus Eisenbacteria sp.]|nr:acetate--CoA ligase family protein [Candidatus Eisenbacteria bacterium]
MRLYEYEAKKVFETVGLRVPRQYGVIHSPADLDALALEFPVMLKAMVMIGGRGKAGGIKKAKDLAEAKAIAEKLLKLVIKGYPVEALLVEEVVSEAGACYLGVTTNPATFSVIVMASAEGGVDIERVALEKPEAILKREIPANDATLPAATAREFASFLHAGLGGDQSLEAGLQEAVAKLYQAFQQYDCKVAEVNPLIVTTDGTPIAADAKVVLDDNALYRQGALFELLGIKESRHDVSELTRDEQRARDAGFLFVDLLPQDAVKDPEKLYVGLVPGGAGYGIFSIDEVVNVGNRYFDGQAVPVNFMDSGGGPTLARVAEMFHLLMDKEIVDVIVTSRFGGISSCAVFIRGLIQCLRDRHERGLRMLPVHGRMVGTDLPGAREYLTRAKAETPESLKDLEIIVGNQKIMADVIREGLAKGLEFRAKQTA